MKDKAAQRIMNVRLEGVKSPGTEIQGPGLISGNAGSGGNQLIVKYSIFI